MEPQVRAVYRIGDAEVDPVGGCIRRDGKELYLRPKSLGVLLLLIERRDEVVSKQHLMSAVWGDVAVAEDVLVGCIMEIRKTLGDHARHPRFLRTVPKVGYRLVREAQDTPAHPPGRRFLLPAAMGTAALGLAILLGAAASRLHSPVASAGGEVAWWRLDEAGGATIGDSSGNGNSGRLAGGVRWTAGILGSALRFDGVSGQVQGITPGRALPRGSAPRTLAAWIRTASSNGDRTAIFQYGTAAPLAGVSATLGLDELGRPVFQTSPWITDVAGVTRLDDDAWHHLAAVYEGPETGTGRLFVDGVEEGSARLPRRPETGDVSPWSMGAFLGNGTHFRGAIDDARVFNRALRGAEIQALYGCSLGQPGLALPVAGAHYLLPVFSGNIRIERSALIRNAGTGYAGVQFARSDGRCAVATLRGENVGQDLDMKMDILVPTDTAGNVSEAGPYFRSRAAAPGDGIVGGTSSGYWVQLHSNGVVRVKRLNPHAIVAFAAARPGFDPAVFHHLEISARGRELTVRLDGDLLSFDQAGQAVTTVEIPSVWEGPPAVGHNDGAAGMAFGSELLNSQIGGQQVKNLMVSVLRPGVAPNFP